MIARFHYDEKMLSRLLRDELGSESREIQEHVETCELCQEQLESLSAGDMTWDEVCDLMRTDDLPDYDVKVTETTPDTKTIFLEASDDPNSLGRFGRYEIREILGRGGMGIVMRGIDSALDRHCAIKVLAPELAGSAAARKRFSREARSAAAVVHPHVVPIQTVDEQDGLPYLVMPVVEGRSLQQRVEHDGPLDVIEAVRIAAQIASGLSAAHSQGLVHRDIKPANVLLENGVERVQITDFGLARAVDDASMTRSGVIAGTPQYMSPEQAHGDAIDYRSDLYSLGSVMYFMLTGRSPFRAETSMGVLNRICNDQPRSLQSINSDIPEWLCRIIEHLMAKHPADRFQDGEEVAKLLENCLAHLQQPTQFHLPQSVALRKEDALSPQSGKQSRGSRQEAKPRSSRWRRVGIGTLIGLLFLAGMGLTFGQLTKPVDIAGRWSGETWKSVSLSGAEVASGWYTGSFSKENGDRGAIQLEWSRLQQRYNGRWKIGDDLSGSITLRAKGNQLAGAVTVDADLSVPAEIPRLREFAWKRAPVGPSDSESIPLSEWAAGPPISIKSPIKGRVSRWGDGVYENARVEKGALIAEVANLDPVYRDRLEMQFDQLSDRLNAAQQILDAKARELEAIRTGVATYQSQQSAYEEVVKQVAEASQLIVETAKHKVEAARAEQDESAAARDQAQADYDRQKKLFDKDLVSQFKLRQTESKLKEAEAKLKKAEALIRVAENELTAKENEHAGKLKKAKLDLTYAVSQVSQAKAEMSKVESEIAKAERDLAEARREHKELQTKLSQQANMEVIAPVTGFVTDLIDTSLKQGDEICTLWPERVRDETGDIDTDEQSPGDDEAGEDEDNSGPSSSNTPSASEADKPSGVSHDQGQELVDTLSRIAENTRKRFKLGEADLTEVVEAEQKLIQAQIAIADAEERPSLRQTQLELAKKMEAFVQEAVKQGARPPADLLKAKANRLELEMIVRRREDEKATSPDDNKKLDDDKKLEAFIQGTGKVVAFDPQDQPQSVSSPVPDTSELAVELWISGNDTPLVQRGAPVRLQFEGWPVVESVGSFAGKVITLDPAADEDGKFRILVMADSKDSWPDERYLRPGVRTRLDQTRIPPECEVWQRGGERRQFCANN